MLKAVSALSSGIDGDTLYLEESVYRVLLDSSLWGPHRQEGSRVRDTTGHASYGAHRRPSQLLEQELWDEVGRTEAVAVTHSRPRHPVEQWEPTGSDGADVTGASHPHVDADNRRVRPKSGGRVAGFRARGTTSVLTRGTLFCLLLLVLFDGAVVACRLPGRWSAACVRRAALPMCLCSCFFVLLFFFFFFLVFFCFFFLFFIFFF